MDPIGVCIWTMLIVSFVLFLIRVASIFYHNIKLSRELKRSNRANVAARQNNATTVSSVVEQSNQTGNQPPKDDLPPAYDDVVQTYINAKLALQAAEEGRCAASNAAMTNASSTVTIDTCIDLSTQDLSITGGHDVTLTTHDEIHDAHTSTDSAAPPPTYESTLSTENDCGTNHATTHDIS